MPVAHHKFQGSLFVFGHILCTTHVSGTMHLQSMIGDPAQLQMFCQTVV